MAEAAEVIAENVIPTNDQAGQQQEVVPEDSSEIGAEQNSQTANINAGAENTKEKKPPKTPWYQIRINELTRERKEAEEREKREVERLTAELRTVRNSSNPNGVTTSTTTAPAGQTQEEFNRAVQEHAKVLKTQSDFNAACGKVYSTGQNEFKGVDGQITFDAALAQLGQLGDIPPELLQAVTTLDNGHRVLFHLGNDLDMASELIRLPPVQLAIRIADLNTQLGKPNSKPVSRAPAPITQVSGVGANDDLSKMSINSFMERRNRDAPIRR